jgi:hypothetical protein
MGKSKKVTSLRKGSTSNLEEKVHGVYAHYISRVIIEPKSIHSYDIYELVSGKKSPVKGMFEDMLKMPVTNDMTSFDSKVLELTNRLKQVERASVPGVFFAILFRHKGNRYLCILKLELSKESWTIFDKKTSMMTLKEVLGELPGKDRFKKGAVYPHPVYPNDAYMKVFQKDYPSKYFDEFLGGGPRVRAKTMFVEFKNLTKKISGSWPDYRQQMGLYQGIKSRVGDTEGMVDVADAVDIIKAAIPSHASKAKKIVEDNIVHRGVLRASEVRDLKMELTIGTLQLKGSFEGFGKHFRANVNRAPDKHRLEGRITGMELV